MEDGRVIERGTHDELMRARGMDYDMVMRQTDSPHAVEEVHRRMTKSSSA